MGGKAKAFKPLLIQDHERALWTDEAREAMAENGVELVERYPKCSQDLNLIETAWRELRERLYATEPMKIETREEFIIRLRLAVQWVNRNRRRYLCNEGYSQKDRAKDVMANDGGRTQH